MQLIVVNLFLLFIFLVLNVYLFDVSLNVPLTHSSSSSISLREPCKNPSASRIIYTKASYIYVTSDLIKILSILFLWALYLLSGIICIKVRFINFESNISVLRKLHATHLLSNNNNNIIIYFYTRKAKPVGVDSLLLQH